MTSTITFQFIGTDFAALTLSITISGGAFQLTGGAYFGLNGSFPLSALVVSADAVVFRGAPGDTANGTMTVPATGSQPTITAEYFSGTLTVSWQSNNGPQTQPLASGVPLILTGFSG
jgi:hypothetical protein